MLFALIQQWRSYMPMATFITRYMFLHVILCWEITVLVLLICHDMLAMLGVSPSNRHQEKKPMSLWYQSWRVALLDQVNLLMCFFVWGDHEVCVSERRKDCLPKSLLKLQVLQLLPRKYQISPEMMYNVMSHLHLEVPTGPYNNEYNKEQSVESDHVLLGFSNISWYWASLAEEIGKFQWRTATLICIISNGQIPRVALWLLRIRKWTKIMYSTYVENYSLDPSIHSHVYAQTIKLDFIK